MPSGTQRIVDPYFQFAWTSRTEFSLARPARSGERGEVIKYSLSPSWKWTAAPRAVKFRFKTSKDGAVSWSLA
jgi:hypothetical protein